MKKFVHIFWLFAIVMLATTCKDDKPVEVSGTGIELLAPYPEAVLLPGDMYEIKPDAIHYFHARLTPRDATDKVIWSSSNENVATVNGDGYVTGISQGTCTIQAKIEGKDLSASVQVAVSANFDADQITGPYKGVLTTTATGAASAPVPNVVAKLTRITSKTLEMKTPSVRIPNGLASFSASITCELNLSMNISGDFILEGRGNLSYQNWAFTANGIVDINGNLVLDMEVTAGSYGSLSLTYTARDAGGFAGDHVGAAIAALYGLSVPNVAATITRTSPTSLEFESERFSMAALGLNNVGLKAALSVSLDDNWEFVFTGSGSSTLAPTTSVNAWGTADRAGNIDFSWDFTPLGAQYGTFKYVVTAQP